MPADSAVLSGIRGHPTSIHVLSLYVNGVMLLGHGRRIRCPHSAPPPSIARGPCTAKCLAKEPRGCSAGTGRLKAGSNAGIFCRCGWPSAASCYARRYRKDPHSGHHAVFARDLRRHGLYRKRGRQPLRSRVEDPCLCWIRFPPPSTHSRVCSRAPCDRLCDLLLPKQRARLGRLASPDVLPVPQRGMRVQSRRLRADL
jgi:hypothetical protein